MIYHLAKKSAWNEAQETGVYRGAEADRADGFLHLSTDKQIRESARKHRTGESDLVLLFVDETQLPETLVWEASRGGQLFPHLYESLPIAAVTGTADLPLDRSGDHVFPENLPASFPPSTDG
ncbi:MAG: DUF952 domain-containing protein [Alphaproteobacteria bacterium]